ncbi:hypothetical protein MAH4_15200 [Sessilibacter sp. MAH4]
MGLDGCELEAKGSEATSAWADVSHNMPENNANEIGFKPIRVGRKKCNLREITQPPKLFNANNVIN